MEHSVPLVESSLEAVAVRLLSAPVGLRECGGCGKHGRGHRSVGAGLHNILDVPQEDLCRLRPGRPSLQGSSAWDALGVQLLGNLEKSKSELGAKLMLAGRMAPCCASASTCGLSLAAPLKIPIAWQACTPPL